MAWLTVATKKKKKLYICLYILICKTNVFIWKLGENLPPSLPDWPRCAMSHSKGHDLQVMKVALASRTKPLLIHLLAEHKATWFSSAHLQRLTEQSTSSPRKGWVCFRKGVIYQSSPPFLLFYGFNGGVWLSRDADHPWVNPNRVEMYWKKTLCVFLQILCTGMDSGMQRMPWKGQQAPSPAAVHAPPPHEPWWPQTLQEHAASNGHVSERPCLLGYGQTDGMFQQRILLNTSLPHFLPSATEKMGLH